MQAGIVVGDFGGFGGGDGFEFGGAGEGGDVVEGDVAGAFLVELWDGN